MDEERSAVVSHRLLNQSSVVTGGLATARLLLERGDVAGAVAALELAERQAQALGESLRELILGRGEPSRAS